MSQDPAEALESFIKSHLADHLNTTLEGVIVAYNAGRVDVKATGTKNYTDGDSLAFPVLYDLPLCWLAGDGGRAGFKAPVKVGDKCTIIFKQQPQQDGDVNTTRRFSCADAQVLPGVSYPDDLGGNDTARVYYGDAFFEVTGDGKVNIHAPGGFQCTAPTSAFSEKVVIAGETTVNNALSVQGASTLTGGATIAGSKYGTHTHLEKGDGQQTSGPNNP